jgi:hypothetical protein
MKSCSDHVMCVPLQGCPKSECRLTYVRMQWVKWTNCALCPLLAVSCGDAGVALFTLTVSSPRMDYSTDTLSVTNILLRRILFSGRSLLMLQRDVLLPSSGSKSKQSKYAAIRGRETSGGVTSSWTFCGLTDYTASHSRGYYSSETSQ